MKITKYASKSCVKCKVLDNILKQAGVEYDVLYSEDNEELFKEKGINTLPTLIFEGKEERRLEGIVSPAQIKEVVAEIE